MDDDCDEDKFALKKGEVMWWTADGSVELWGFELCPIQVRCNRPAFPDFADAVYCDSPNPLAGETCLLRCAAGYRAVPPHATCVEDDVWIMGTCVPCLDEVEPFEISACDSYASIPSGPALAIVDGVMSISGARQYARHAALHAQSKFTEFADGAAMAFRLRLDIAVDVAGIVGGKNAGSLKVQINGGKIGYACRTALTEQDADVACRQLGHARGTLMESRVADPGDQEEKIVLPESLNCTGDETTLTECGHPALGWAMWMSYINFEHGSRRLQSGSYSASGSYSGYCMAHDDCPQMTFCESSGSCYTCDDCHYCSSGIDGTSAI
jgi:hypothetical protein